VSELSELRARYERLELLYQVSNAMHSTLEPSAALERMLQEVVRVTHATSGSIVLVNPKTGMLEIETCAGLPPGSAELKLKVGEGITGWVARTGKVARVGDVRKDPRYIMLRDSIRSELAAPLEERGEVRGVINVDSDRVDAFSVEDQELLEALAGHATQAIHNTWLYQQVRLKARLLETLLSVSQTINTALNVDEALQVIAREACALMEAKMCSILMLDPTGGWLDVRAHHGAGSSYLTKPRLSVEDSFVGIVVRRRKPMQLENVQASGSYQNAAMARAEGLVSLLSAPLLFRGQAIGALNLYHGKPHAFSNEEVHIVSALAELSAIAIEKARLHERIVDAEDQMRQNEKLSALGLLAAEVAHEIRNPLTVMKMLYHSLDLQFPPGDPRVKDDEILREKMDHLNKIVEQILNFARSAEPKLTPIDVNKIIDDLALLTRHKLRNQGVQCERVLARDLPPILADASQLSQAFLNLTLNAVQAMPEGGTLKIITRPVRLPRSSVLPTHVQIEFADTGQGVPEAIRQRAFSSLLSTTKVGGAGLGLAIVGRVVESHRGKVKIKSKPGKGAAIVITLPAQDTP
jgi:signal transduction histidine kinase